MTDTTGNYDELDPEIEKAFPYVLTDNDRNRMVFGSGYRAARQSDYFESLRSRIAALEAAIRPERLQSVILNALEPGDAIWVHDARLIAEAIASEAPSTVLDQMIREAKAEALEDLAKSAWVENMEPFYDPHAEGRVSVYYLINERAAAYRNGDA